MYAEADAKRGPQNGTHALGMGEDVIHYQDDHITLYHGDALATVAALPDASVDCIVTSPPYFGLRDYGTEGQYGLEASPAEYVETNEQRGCRPPRRGRVHRPPNTTHRNA